MASRKKNGYYSKTIVHKDLVIIPDPNQPSTSKVKLKEGGGGNNQRVDLQKQDSSRVDKKHWKLTY